MIEPLTLDAMKEAEIKKWEAKLLQQMHTRAREYWPVRSWEDAVRIAHDLEPAPVPERWVK